MYTRYNRVSPHYIRNVGCSRMISLIIDRNVDVTGELGGQVLARLVRWGNKNDVTMLLERNVDITKYGGPALVEVCQSKYHRDNLELLLFLLDHHADITSEYAQSALVSASRGAENDKIK